MAFTSVVITLEQPAYADCILDEDWPEKPCLDTPPYSNEYLRQVWEQYYEYKGKEWMDEKRAEMDMAIQNGTLREWVETQSSPDNFANHNVWQYYYLNEAPNAYGQQPTPEQLQECRELRITPDKCSEEMIWEQSQMDIAMYLIGIGAAIAGIMAFLILRKRKK